MAGRRSLPRTHAHLGPLPASLPSLCVITFKISFRVVITSDEGRRGGKPNKVIIDAALKECPLLELVLGWEVRSVGQKDMTSGP